MKKINIRDEKTQHATLIDKVLKGEKIIIARNNQPVVELEALKKQKRIPGLLKDKIKIIGSWEESDLEIKKILE